MEHFATTDMYLASYMKQHSSFVECTKVGGKIMFNFSFLETGNAEKIHRLYLEDNDIMRSRYIESLIRKDIEARGLNIHPDYDK